MTGLVPTELIQSRILVLRGQRIIIDANLAALYGVPTKRLNEQVRRNSRKFPEDFVFRLAKEESEMIQRSRSQKATLNLESNRSQNATGSQKYRDPRFLPYAFTEHGAIQAANILNSQAATEMSVQVVRAFVRLRQLIVSLKARQVDARREARARENISRLNKENSFSDLDFRKALLKVVHVPPMRDTRDAVRMPASASK